MMWLSNEVVDHLRNVAAWPDVVGDRYVVARPIGRGGMGTVYAARDELLGRDVALKVSNAPVSGSGLDERLRREARVLATLDHPGIAPVHDAGVLADGRLFYVMKLVRGETLERHARTLDTESRKLGVFERVADTVAFAHARGIVHRDLKPSNVMVGPFGEVLVLDWGVAKILADAEHDVERDAGPHDAGPHDAGPHDVGPRHVGPRDAEPREAGPHDGALHDAEPRDVGSRDVGSRDAGSVTRVGTLLGTPGFMAPEQRAGDPARIGPGSDVYALGALLFWLLADEVPPDDVARASRTLRERHVTRRLRAIVARCLASRPEERYAQAGDLAADIVRYRGGQAVDAYPETVFDRAGRFVATYRTFILIVVAYLVMRAVVAFLQR